MFSGGGRGAYSLRGGEKKSYVEAEDEDDQQQRPPPLPRKGGGGIKRVQDEDADYDGEEPVLRGAAPRSSGAAAAAAAAAASAGGGGAAAVVDITRCPYGLIKINFSALTDYKAEVFAMPFTVGGDGGALLRTMGAKVELLSGIRDFSFFSTLPAAGTPVILIRALCPLRDHTLEDGACTFSGSATAAIAEGLLTQGIEVQYENIAMTCWRKGKGGIEAKGSAAGCVDLREDDLKVASIVKELRFLGLQHAGLDILGILAFSNSAIASFGGAPGADYFVRRQGTGVYSGVGVCFLPHPKFLTLAPVFTTPVAKRLGVLAGDKLGVTSAFLDGVAHSLVQLAPSHFGDSEKDMEESEECMYEIVRMQDSMITARIYEERFCTDSTPEYSAMLTEAASENGHKGGDATAAEGKRLGEGTDVYAKARGLAGVPIQDLNVLTNLIISATALVKLNDSLAAFNTAYTGSGSTSTSSSSCYTSLHIDKAKMGITSANIGAVKALFTTHIVSGYTAGGRSALSASGGAAAAPDALYAAVLEKGGTPEEAEAKRQTSLAQKGAAAKAKIGSHYSKAGTEVLAERAAARAILAARGILEPLAQLVASTRSEVSKRKEHALRDFLAALKLYSADEFKQLCVEMENIAKGASSSRSAESASGGGA